MTISSQLLRITKGAALAGFTLGGVHAVWEFARQPHVLEFQVGQGAPWSEKALAIAHSAALEGVGFGLLGLILGTLAISLACLEGRTRKPAGPLVAAQLMLLAAAFFGWVWRAPTATKALPYLSGTELGLLDALGPIVLFAAMHLFHRIVRRLPWTPRDAPVATALSCVMFAAAAAALAWPFLDLGGWRTMRGIAITSGIFAFALSAASYLVVVGHARIEPLAERLGARPFLPRWTYRVMGLGLAASIVGTAPLFRLSPVPRAPSYERSAQRGEPAGPNVVFVTIDTLRADHLGCYGYARPTSPFIDSLARAGTRFADPVAAAGWTKPSTGTMFTGLHPSRHGALLLDHRLQLPEGMRTLAEAFREAGYVTAAFIANPHIKSVFGFDRGFDVFFDSPLDDTLTSACFRATWIGGILTVLMRHEFDWMSKNDALELNRHVRAWLAENHDQRFFLYVHYIDPHVPYDPPAAYRKEFLQAHGFPIFKRRLELVGQDLYDAEIRHADDGVRELVDDLRSVGVWEDTLLVVTADHGEEFFEHTAHGHGYSLYQSLVRVPLILHGPNVPAGQVVEQPVQHLDLPATVLELAGLELERFGDGRSFAGALRDLEWEHGGEYFLENEFAWPGSEELDFIFSGVRKGRWKLILTGHNALLPPEQWLDALYDLSADPDETNNVIDDPANHAIVQELRETLRLHSEYLRATGFRDAEPTPISPDVEAALKALGY